MKKAKSGHLEIIGETIAKFELFQKGWNPYSRFLDEEKVDLLLRKRTRKGVVYREIQVKYGKLYKCGIKWEQKIFDYTSWRFFNYNEFKRELKNKNFFIIYVLVPTSGYVGDIFIFPIKDFNSLINKGIKTTSKTKNKNKRKLYISRQIGKNKWFVRKDGIEINSCSLKTNCIDITSYRRNFKVL